VDPSHRSHQHKTTRCCITNEKRFQALSDTVWEGERRGLVSSINPSCALFSFLQSRAPIYGIKTSIVFYTLSTLLPSCTAVHQSLCIPLLLISITQPRSYLSAQPCPGPCCQYIHSLGTFPTPLYPYRAMHRSSVSIHPLVIAGWCGFTTQVFNMLPAGRLDGGRAIQVSRTTRHPLPFHHFRTDAVNLSEKHRFFL
jgi:hypothetical protein